MNTNYKTVLVISFSLLLLAIGSSLSNYLISMNATKTQIKTQSLPLSVDNIYTAIQKNVIEPSLVASMMSNDTFVIDWLLQGEKDPKKIEAYLESIKNKYKMMVSFLVSKNSLNYYTQDGILKQIREGESEDHWYYHFQNSNENHEINLDWNKQISNKMIMFINYKIFDKEFHFLGATGVGLKISYIDEMLRMFKERYKLHVSFLNKSGAFLLTNNDEYKNIKSIDTISVLKEHKKEILSKDMTMFEYEKNSATYILESKYVPELNTYLLVEANLEDFTGNTKNTFYINLGISLVLTLFIAIIIITLIRGFHKKLELLATHDPLTQLANRRSFSKDFEKFLLLSKRNKQTLSLLFIDLDEFKKINDKRGHNVGDIILQEFATILKSNIRSTDICARWGGEEFVIAFIDSSAEESLSIANKIKEACQNNNVIHSALGEALTISAGLTQAKESDTIDTIISRADGAMYIAKSEGKNRVHLLND